MAGRGRELKVYLTSDVSKFGKGLRQAESRLGKFRKIAGGALAGVAAAAGTAAVAFGVEGVQAAADDEKAAKKLAKTMENLGKAQDVDKAEDFIEALMQQTGIADDELRPAFEKLVQATGDTDSALALLKTAIDTSVGASKPLETVVTGIAKGMDGQVGALQRLIPGLDTAALKADPLNSIMGQLNGRFSGQAATRMDTYSGKADAIATAFSELQESFGKGLLGNLVGTGDAMGSMDDTLYSLGPAMEELGSTFGGIATSIAKTAEYIGPVVEGFNKLNSMGDGLLTNGTLVNTMEALSRAQYVIAMATGNDVAAMEAQSGTGANIRLTPETGTNGGDFGPNPYASYRPMRFATRKNDAEVRGDARAAQREARTRQQP